MKRQSASRYVSLLASAFGFAVVALAAPLPGDHAAANAHAAPHWEYKGKAGPAAWGELSPDFAACAAGRHQSPIDLAPGLPGPSTAQRKEFPPAELEVRTAMKLGDAVHNGHTIQVDFPHGDTLTIGGVPFELVQFHFHAPSEHTVSGKHFPMEIHFVHRSAEGKLAVLGVLAREGATSAAFERIESRLPTAEGGKSSLEKVSATVGELLPKSHDIDRYDGSLTTPPCSEQVSWFVMTEPIELSKAQIALLVAALPENSRPVQPASGRAVIEDVLAVRTATDAKKPK